MGIPTVGVYTEPDRDALHVETVDVAVAIGSYLEGGAIVDAALVTGATHIHPGYGFLAENAGFAAAVADAGLTWIGPTPDQIRLLGDKVAAKRAAIEAGVPTTEIIEVADGEVPDGLTMPVLVKAAAGGGGRGMRVVHDGADLPDAIASASREAESAFGDGTVFIEPFIERGRHVEVQVLGDTHGNVVHLGERECSIQRRNQKVVEEAPSPGISDDVRRRLHDGALALARHVGYVGAGTVEFMVGDDGTITFLEVNTRLQVEHPVTEAVTGIDLVEMQIGVANGHALPFGQDDVTFAGHAIEVRVVAEDPAADWLPSTGTISEFAVGRSDGPSAVRVDTGVRAGSTVSPDYDSLLAKVIAHHADRNVAALRIAQAMRTARVVGVRTNAAALAAIMDEPDFRAGHTFTAYLDEHPDVLTDADPAGPDLVAHLVAVALADERRNRADDPATGFAPSGWRNLRTRGQRRTWLLGDDEHRIEYVLDGDRVDVLVGRWPEPLDDGSLPPDERRPIGGRILATDGADGVSGSVAIELDGVRRTIDVAFHGADTVRSAGPTGTVVWSRPSRFAEHDADEAGSGPVCPLPGTVIAVHVEAGDRVSDGQLLMVVEAMKMEHKITAHGDHVVAEVRFAVGDRVDSGDLLVELGDPT